MNTHNAFSCVFTGHRPKLLPWGYDESASSCARMKELLTDEVVKSYHKGYRNFYCGMALGGDMIFAETVLSLNDLIPDIALFAVIPYSGQPDSWHDSQKIRYRRILDKCAETIILQEKYAKDCMKNRNYYMVDKSSRLIAIYDGISHGGTMQTIRYAKEQELEIVVIKP